MTLPFPPPRQAHGSPETTASPRLGNHGVLTSGVWSTGGGHRDSVLKTAKQQWTSPTREPGSGSQELSSPQSWVLICSPDIPLVSEAYPRL